MTSPGRRRLSVHLATTLAACAIAWTHHAEARKLSEGAILSRCYAQLTGENLASDDPLRKRLGAEKASAICASLLDGVKFDATTGVLTEKDDRTAKRILRQFDDMHRSWLSHGFMNNNEFGEPLFGTVDIQDIAEPSYFLTRTLFTEGLHYNSALQGEGGLEAIRNSSGASAAGSTSGFFRASRAFLGSFDANAEMNWNTNQVLLQNATSAPPFASISVPLIPVGELIGIRPRALTDEKTPTLVTKNGAVTNEATLSLPHDLRRSYGGGALGSQSFLLYNFGHDLSYVSNGTSKLPRRWITEAFSSFLCRSGPLLRESDVASFQKPFAAGTPAFRNAKSCMQCHAALDQSAMTARNLTPSATAFMFLQVRESATVASFTGGAPAEPGQEFWPATDALTFRNQAPKGKLFFRSVTGALVNVDVDSIAALGKALSETDDYYACAASRYVEHLTGVSVPQMDPVDLAALGEVNAKDREWRALVQTLGQELRATGSLKTMVRHIFESAAYAQSDFGRFGIQ
jgi:hypothetical protein